MECRVSASVYLTNVLEKYRVNEAAARAQANLLMPIIQRWANKYLLSAEFSGSIARGTAVSLSTDADVFISLSSATPDTLQQIYTSLCEALTGAGLPIRRQNVSVGTTVGGMKVDLVPGKRQSQYGNEHSLYKNKTGTWTKTDVQGHINCVSRSNRVSEIRLLKIWKCLNGLEFPSFYLELTVIERLRGAAIGDLSGNVWSVFNYLASDFAQARYVDPCNTNNVISDDLTAAEKQRIRQAAQRALEQKSWDAIFW